ncbi:MAG: membrane protein insertase YidC, partial [bacterium]
MQIDRNSVIGFVLLAILFFGYFYFTRQGQIELEQKQKRIQDSLARIAPPRKDSAKLASIAQATDTASSLAVSASGSLVQTGRGTEIFDTLENEVLKIVFSNRGGQPALVELKKYLSFDSTPVRLVQPGFDRLSYRVRSEGAAEVSSADLYFTDGSVTRQPDGTRSITYK